MFYNVSCYTFCDEFVILSYKVSHDVAFITMVTMVTMLCLNEHNHIQLMYMLCIPYSCDGTHFFLGLALLLYGPIAPLLMASSH